MKKVIMYLVLIALVLMPFNVGADTPLPNCGLNIGDEVVVNVSDTEQRRFYILGDTEALAAGADQSTSVVRLISKDNLLDSLSFNTEIVEYSNSDLKATIEEETKGWKNVSKVGLLTESDLNYYFVSSDSSDISKDFLKANASNGYWTEYVYTSGTDEGKVITITEEADLNNKEVTSDAAVRVVIEMPTNKACSANGGTAPSEPSGDENASTGDLDIVIYIGAAVGLVALASYSYKKKNG